MLHSSPATTSLLLLPLYKGYFISQPECTSTDLDREQRSTSGYDSDEAPSLSSASGQDDGDDDGGQLNQRTSGYTDGDKDSCRVSTLLNFPEPKSKILLYVT